MRLSDFSYRAAVRSPAVGNYKTAKCGGVTPRRSGATKFSSDDEGRPIAEVPQTAGFNAPTVSCHKVQYVMPTSGEFVWVLVVTGRYGSCAVFGIEAWLRGRKESCGVAKTTEVACGDGAPAVEEGGAKAVPNSYHK